MTPGNFSAFLRALIQRAPRRRCQVRRVAFWIPFAGSECNPVKTLVLHFGTRLCSR